MAIEEFPIDGHKWYKFQSVTQALRREIDCLTYSVTER